MKKLKICVSACLLGFKYRYDGTADYMPELTERLKDIADFIPFCPEVESGLPIPRKKMHLEASSRGTRLIVTETREDLTEQLIQWADTKLDQLLERTPDGFLFHAKSPCCGLGSTKLYNAAGRILPTKGTGIFAGIFRMRCPKLIAGEQTDLEAFLRDLHVLRNNGSR